MTKARDLASNAEGTKPKVIDAAGDLIYGTGSDAASRLAIGTAGQLLTVNSGATAPEWITVGGGEKTYTLLNTGGTALTGATTITISGISGISSFWVMLRQASSANAFAGFSVRPNSATTGAMANSRIEVGATYSAGMFSGGASAIGGTINLGTIGDNAGHLFFGSCFIFGGSSTGLKGYIAQGACQYDAAIDTQTVQWQQGLINPGGAITSIDIVSSSGNFDNGTVYVYGAV